MDIAAWLHGLGLEQYEPAFRDNAIDADILTDLADADLEKLGVALLGHRKRLLKAIAALVEQREAGTPVASPPSIPSSASVPVSIPERRQLTVMFVDLVGSTELSHRLDPEAMGDLLRAYHNAVASEIARFEGHVAKYMGDGVLAYFGWPCAHEDDGERAVRAGLAVVEAVAGLKAPDSTRITARVGIATGRVVVGDLIGSEEAREQAVVGETPNLAARVQGLAEPGSVVISRGTRRLVHGLFELVDLGAHHLKGFAELMHAWRVLGPSRSEGRFEARHGRGLTPLVGRDHELALLLDRWQQAKEGEGQVVLLSGEPGIGKSRLVHALRERLTDEPYTPLSHFCSPFHQTSALHPVIDLLSRAAGLAQGEPPGRSLDKLEALLARGTADVASAAALIAPLMSVPAADRYPPLNLTPQRQKEETFSALLAQLAGLAAEQPVLVLYEDVHWADPTTLELMGRVIERAPGLPILVLITFRPELTPSWHGQAHVTSLTLNRLSRKRGAALVAGLTGGKALPPEVLEQIILKTDGVPLFVEELTKAVTESGLLAERDDRYELESPLPPLAIPPTLHDSLMARLDRLAPVKEVAQMAACIGREFDYQLLAAVAPLEEVKLQDALRQLTEAELVFGYGAPPQAGYTFKHALVRDAAYESLLKSRRQRLHARIVETLEGRFSETATAQPQLLAHHCGEAGLVAKAVEYWLKAGQQNVARSAMAEAVAQLTRGLELLEGLPGGPERQQAELGLHVALGQASIAAKGFAAPETGRAHGRACELAQEVGNSPELFPALYGLSVFHQVRGELAAAHEVARNLLHLAQERGDAAAEMAGHRIVGSALFELGSLVESRDQFEAGLALYEPVRDRASALIYAMDSRVMCLSWLSYALVVLGYPEQALARDGEARAYARELAHPPTAAVALAWGCIVRQFLRHERQTFDQAEALISLATEQRLPFWLAIGTIVRGWAQAALGHAAAGIVTLSEGLSGWRQIGAELFVPYYLALLAEVQGQATNQLELLENALTRVEGTGERWFEAELHRRKGEALLALAPRDLAGAEACYGRALAAARKQKARLWELRAATSLARLWAMRSERAKAHDLLAPICGWFTEGFDTPDLIEANTLLDELR